MSSNGHIYLLSEEFNHDNLNLIIQRKEELRRDMIGEGLTQENTYFFTNRLYGAETLFLYDLPMDLRYLSVNEPRWQNTPGKENLTALLDFLINWPDITPFYTSEYDDIYSLYDLTMSLADNRAFKLTRTWVNSLPDPLA